MSNCLVPAELSILQSLSRRPYAEAITVDQTLELQQQIVRLQALFEASRRIHSTIQLDEVLR